MTTIVNLISLADTILEEKGQEGHLLSEYEYRDLCEEIFGRVSHLGQWSGVQPWGKEFEDDQLLMMRLGETFYLSFHLIIICFISILIS